MILKYSYIQIKLLRSNLTDNELNYHASYWTEGSLNHINLKDFHKGWIHQRAGAKQARVMSCMIPAVVKCMLFPRRSAARLGSEAPTIGTPILAAPPAHKASPCSLKVLWKWEDAAGWVTRKGLIWNYNAWLGVSQNILTKWLYTKHHHLGSIPNFGLPMAVF